VWCKCTFSLGLSTTKGYPAPNHSLHTASVGRPGELGCPTATGMPPPPICPLARLLLTLMLCWALLMIAQALYAFRRASEGAEGSLSNPRRPSTSPCATPPSARGGGAGAGSGPATPQDPLGPEKAVWFALYEGARLSVKHGTVLVLW
jgi:hypothetical protein